MLIRQPFPLFEEKKDPPDGGAPPVIFTDDQQKAVGALISAAFKGEGKRLVAAAVKDSLAELKIGETIAAEVAKLKPVEPEQKPDTGKPDPKVSALEAQLQELKQQRAADAEALKREKETSRDKDAMAALRSALTPHVRPEALEIATRDLFVAQKRVTFDEQGNPLLTVRRAAYAGASEEDTPMPLTDGVGHWIKTPEGKFFAPAPVGGGSDPRGGKGPQRSVNTGADGMPRYEQPATTDAEKVRRASEREQAIRTRFPNL